MSPLAFLARPSAWLRAIHRHRGTISGGPNFSYELCLRRIPEHELEGLDLSSWRFAFNGAEPVSPETMIGFSREIRARGASTATRCRRSTAWPSARSASRSRRRASPGRWICSTARCSRAAATPRSRAKAIRRRSRSWLRPGDPGPRAARGRRRRHRAARPRRRLAPVPRPLGDQRLLPQPRGDQGPVRRRVGEHRRPRRSTEPM